MIYIYDLVLNFNDCFRNLDFYEWRKTDNIVTIQKIPVFKINRFQMNDVLNNKIKVNDELLKKIENKTILQGDKILKYAFLVTDLSRVLALEVGDNGEVVRSSGLLLDEEEAVIDECLNNTLDSFFYEVVATYEKSNFLTREEEKIRNSLLSEIKTLYKNKDYDEIEYLYEELFDDKINIHKKYEFLINDIGNNFNSKYRKLYEIIKLTSI